jgi:hypothetical protein
MKKYIIIVLCAVALSASAQTGDGIKTLFGGGKPEIGYFINPLIQSCNFAGSYGIEAGSGAGVIFNDRLAVSMQYKFSVTEKTPAGEVNQLYIHGQWLGLKTAYILKPESIVHFSFPVEVGAGEVEMDVKDAFEESQIAVPSDDLWYAYIEPGVALEINMLKNLKLNLGAGYRFVSNMTYRTINSADLRGISFSASLKIGIF